MENFLMELIEIFPVELCISSGTHRENSNVTSKQISLRVEFGESFSVKFKQTFLVELLDEFPMEFFEVTVSHYKNKR